MVSSRCFVPGCKTGYDSDKKKRKAEGNRKLSLFCVPKEEDRLRKWKNAIPRSDRKLSTNDRVCELHFLPDEIVRDFVHKMPDGNIVAIERGKTSLMKDAVPSLFPNVPSYLSKNNKKRKPPLKRMPLPNKKAKKDTLHIEEMITIEETATEFTFNDLLLNVSEISKPNRLWSISSHEDFIICVKWNLNFAPERQIIIDTNLGVLIMYCGIKVTSLTNTVIDSIHALSQVIKDVDEYAVCSGAINRNKNCSVFMKRDWGSFGRPPKWCIGCKNKKIDSGIKSK